MFHHNQNSRYNCYAHQYNPKQPSKEILEILPIHHPQYDRLAIVNTNCKLFENYIQIKLVENFKYFSRFTTVDSRLDTVLLGIDTILLGKRLGYWRDRIFWWFVQFFFSRERNQMLAAPFIFYYLNNSLDVYKN